MSEVELRPQRVVVYMRVVHASENAVADQKSLLQKFCEERGIVPLQEIADHGGERLEGRQARSG